MRPESTVKIHVFKKSLKMFGFLRILNITFNSSFWPQLNFCQYCYFINKCILHLFSSLSSKINRALVADVIVDIFLINLRAYAEKVLC